MIRALVATALVVSAVACTPNATTGEPVAAGSGPFTNTGTCHARHVNVTDPQAWEPDPACAPGSTEGGLSLDQLCPVAHTRPIRPPTGYTEPIKRAQMREYGATQPINQYEEDHIISLELGGSPRDVRNLWPEPHPSPNEKDRVEGAAHAAVCNHTITLAYAQTHIAQDWYALGKELHAVS